MPSMNWEDPSIYHERTPRWKFWPVVIVGWAVRHYGWTHARMRLWNGPLGSLVHHPQLVRAIEGINRVATRR